MRRLAIFPLPGVVLFPGIRLPLHVFEPRYRKMVADALTGDRVIGMAMLVDASAAGAPALAPPAVRPIGGAGIIVEHEKLEDGRYNIVLEGSFRFRIVRETPSSPYRIAEVEEASLSPFERDEDERTAVGRVVASFAAVAPELELPPLPSDPLDAERLSGEIATRLRYSPDDLQDLLETTSLAERFRRVEERLTEWHETLSFLRPYRPGDVRPLAN